VNISQLPLFAGLLPAALNAVQSRSITRDFAPGAVLWRVGGTPKALHIVLEGEVRVHHELGERVRVLHTEGAGGTLGDVALFAGSPYPATAVAAQRTRCLILDAAAVTAIISADPGFALRLLQRLALRVQQLIERLEHTTEWSVQARLARYLLQRATAAELRPFSLGATQAEVAQELGTVREVVVRTLRELRQQGQLETTTRGRYRICDKAALEALAHKA